MLGQMLNTPYYYKGLGVWIVKKLGAKPPSWDTSFISCNILFTQNEKKLFLEHFQHFLSLLTQQCESNYVRACVRSCASERASARIPVFVFVSCVIICFSQTGVSQTRLETEHWIETQLTLCVNHQAHIPRLFLRCIELLLYVCHL